MMILHTGIPDASRDPRLHTGILSITISVCIRGFTNAHMHMGIVLDHRMHTWIITLQSLYEYGDFQRSLYAYKDLVNYNPCMHMGIP